MTQVCGRYIHLAVPHGYRDSDGISILMAAALGCGVLGRDRDGCNGLGNLVMPGIMMTGLAMALCLAILAGYSSSSLATAGAIVMALVALALSGLVWIMEKKDVS